MMQDYRVELDSYSGPLDLLLYLVRRHEIDLHNIPIAKLTEQYIEHLRLIQRIDVDLAGEFLVMAATLLEIKSAMLLPRPTEEAGGGEAQGQTDPLDPRYELVQQLLAYKRFKDAAAELDHRRQEWAGRHACHPVQPHRVNALPPLDDDGDPNDAAVIEIDLEDANVLDLCKAFVRVIESVGRTPPLHEVVYDDTPVALHAEDIIDRLERDGPMSLQDIFTGRESRSEKIGLLLAMLELVRQSKISFTQNDDDEGRIHLQLRPADQPRQTNDDSRHASASAATSNPQSGEDPYDWPSEEARLTAQRRAQHAGQSKDQRP